MEVRRFHLNENAVVASLKRIHVFPADFFTFPVKSGLLQQPMQAWNPSNTTSLRFLISAAIA